MKKLEITTGVVIGIVAVAIGALYLFNTFFREGEFGREFTIPPNLDTPFLWIIKLGIVAGITTLALWVVSKFTKGSLSRKDILTYVILGVVVWFLWDRILSQFWTINSISNFSIKFAKVARLIP